MPNDTPSTVPSDSTGATPASSPVRVAVLVGSVREGRAGDTVAEWFVSQTTNRDDVTLDVVDLIDYAFAGFPAEHTPGMVQFAQRIGLAEAVVVVTPEYNKSFPAALKQAVDVVVDEWRGKPVGFVSYGGMSQGLRAVEQLRLVFSELSTVTVRDSVCFPSPVFTGDSWPPDPDGAARAAASLMAQLLWWAQALRPARAARPHPS